jgi:hypothetical protein
LSLPWQKVHKNQQSHVTPLAAAGYFFLFKKPCEPLWLLVCFSNSLRGLAPKLHANSLSQSKGPRMSRDLKKTAELQIHKDLFLSQLIELKVAAALSSTESVAVLKYLWAQIVFSKARFKSRHCISIVSCVRCAMCAPAAF